MAGPQREIALLSGRQAEVPIAVGIDRFVIAASFVTQRNHGASERTLVGVGDRPLNRGRPCAYRTDHGQDNQSSGRPTFGRCHWPCFIHWIPTQCDIVTAYSPERARQSPPPPIAPTEQRLPASRSAG